LRCQDRSRKEPQKNFCTRRAKTDRAGAESIKNERIGVGRFGAGALFAHATAAHDDGIIVAVTISPRADGSAAQKALGFHNAGRVKKSFGPVEKS
jgi:hypothetical protein